MSFKKWLQLFRAQTAPATVILVLTSYLVGGGMLFSFTGFLVFVFAVLMHYFSFGHNSLMDTAMGWDVEDAHKQHHPLIKGTMSLGNAHKVIHSGLVFLTLFAILLALLGDGDPFLAMVFFSIFLSAGHAYNDGLSKATVWSFLPITVCFTSLAIFGYYLAAGEMCGLMLLLALYFALTLMFQISLSGELKEIAAREANLLRCMGARVNVGYLMMGGAKYYGWGIKLANLCVGAYILCWYAPSPLTFTLFLLLASVAIYFCHELTRDRLWKRDKSLVHMAAEEIVTIFIAPAVLIPIVGLTESVALMAFGIVYFITLNRINWGTVLRPQV